MAILKWRLWDRLDDLDRRVGIRPLDGKRSATFVEIFALVLLALSVVDLLEGDWIGAIVDGVLGAVAGLFAFTRLARARRTEDGGTHRSL